LSVLGLVILIHNSGPAAINRAALSIYGISLILLYTASTVYHLLPLGETGVARLRLLDHMMIYVLIAGTYTPICVIALPGAWGRGLMIGIWSLAFLGVFTQGMWLNAPRWIGTLYYIVMGWLIIIAVIPMLKVMPVAALIWLLAGGITYSLGGLIYARKKTVLSCHYLGFHEIFHLFILGGSIMHFWMIYRYILPLS
jgi:hemolysin III